MIFTVAAISPERTFWNSASVAMATLSSIALMRWISGASTINTPLRSATRLQRPVNVAVDAKILRPCRAARDGERRVVLGDVASLDPRDDDLGDARRIERGDVTGVEALALFHAEPGLADRMSRYGAFGLADRNGTESHAARPGFAAPSRRCSE